MAESESEPQHANFPEGDGGGGRSSRGPATHVPGKTEPGGVVPPYDGRQEKATDVDSEDGAASPTETVGMTSPDPADTPGGATTTPADEQPAADMPETRDDDPGVGPAHVKGAPTGEGGGR